MDTTAAAELKKYVKPHSAQRLDLKSFFSKWHEPHEGQYLNLSTNLISEEFYNLS
jgi:hypothetical protein